jgi:TorA maturation chaperone TorD
MTRKEMSTESAYPETSIDSFDGADEQRLLSYKAYAVAFSYPDKKLFEHFPRYVQEKQSMISEYDRLFRAGVVWLYGAEHTVKNEFQRANLLADIMGFYTAFGLEPDRERPDSITCELEFMHYLILKRNRIGSDLSADDAREKSEICLDAERKFFVEHMEPTATNVARKIIAESSHPFYAKAATELLTFLESEKRHFGSVDDANRTVEMVKG